MNVDNPAVGRSCLIKAASRMIKNSARRIRFLRHRATHCQVSGLSKERSPCSEASNNKRRSCRRPLRKNRMLLRRTNCQSGINRSNMARIRSKASVRSGVLPKVFAVWQRPQNVIQGTNGIASRNGPRHLTDVSENTAQQSRRSSSPKSCRSLPVKTPSHNGRFLRHRPKRSERSPELTEDCTKASPR